VRGANGKRRGLASGSNGVRRVLLRVSGGVSSFHTIHTEGSSVVVVSFVGVFVVVIAID